MKDAVETFLNREVCRGALELADAQRVIATNGWLCAGNTRYRRRSRRRPVASDLSTRAACDFSGIRPQSQS